jgi:hypothetical protein
MNLMMAAEGQAQVVEGHAQVVEGQAQVVAQVVAEEEEAAEMHK